MKKLFSLTALLLLAAGSAAYTQQGAQPPAQPPAQGQAAQGSGGAKPESVEDRASYAIGLNIGRNMKAQEIPVNVELLVKGLRDALAGTNPNLTDEEMQAAVQSLQQTVMAKQQEKMKVEGEQNQKTADEFLAKNKTKEGVKTTASGLQYEVIKEGTGATPKATDKVTVHYTGTLLNGTKFDSSVDRGQPATFGVNQVISGWTEALQLMKVGGKYRLYVPPALAYGPQGAGGGEIGPNSLLIFDVELIGIGEQPPAGEQQGQTQQQPPGEKQ
jgi:FKBP-type peptidyl-prolyl cis-trans isomerase